MNRKITSEVLVAYSQCPRKAFLLLNTEEKGVLHEYVQILQQKRDDNQNKYLDTLKIRCTDVRCYTASNLMGGVSFLVNATLKIEELEVDCGLLTKVQGNSSLGEFSYEPTIFVETHNINKEQKLELMFAGYVLGKIQEKIPLNGSIVGMDGETHKIRLEHNIKTFIQFLQSFYEWITETSTESSVVLNKHCSYCQFKNICSKIAREADNLSLIKGININEIAKQNNKGIFTVTQLSYTYRPRKKLKGKRLMKYDYALKALSIRENRIYVVKKPEINLENTLIFLDVEGIPDRDFYYLIGLVVVDNHSLQSLSFWADTIDDEKVIWRSFLDEIRKYDNFSLFYYGSYETNFIGKMSKKYPNNDEFLIKKINSNSYNVLSIIYANIYFPTYSNGLKDIGTYLGARWQIEEPSGIQSLVWRYKWETSADTKLKQNIINYNIEDCFATEKVVRALCDISKHDSDVYNDRLDFVFTESIKSELDWRKFRKNDFALEELEFINQCAYFDYQRDKVYFRNERKSKRSSKRKTVQYFKNHHFDKEVEIPSEQMCPRCNSNMLNKHGKEFKTVFDLKFSHHGIKRWIIRYTTTRVKCKSCNAVSYSNQFMSINGKYGWQFKVWITYQIIALRQSYSMVQNGLREFFDYDLGEGIIYRAKSDVSRYYDETYTRILTKLRSGKLIHVDETTVSIKGVNSYVWVFTSLEEVIYAYSPTRDSMLLREILGGFNGILVSDFYSVYDSVDCIQQRCLIHLIRDMNDDLLKNPFDEQYKNFIKSFSKLLKSIIDTIDKYGLRKKYLSNHKADVDIFFNEFVLSKFKSGVVSRYQKRFINNRTKLFTFLDYDNVPWNNNNAEHAIKGFAAHRRIIDGFFDEDGLKRHLVLLSVYKTCEYKKIDFLKFLLSGDQDIDRFSGFR